jgi:hypothetical protein
LKSNIKCIKRINDAGINKLIRNVQSLQQNLTNLESVDDKNLDMVIKYYNLMRMSEKEIQSCIEKYSGMFSYDEWVVVLNLKYGGNSNSDEHSRVLAACKDHFIKNNLPK